METQTDTDRERQAKRYIEIQIHIIRYMKNGLNGFPNASSLQRPAIVTALREFPGA